MLNESIFKSYDVRGIYPDEINEETARVIGRAFSEYLFRKNLSGPVIVGRDVRISSKNLYDAAIQGLLESGRDVIEIGIATTPLFYFSVGFSGAAGGIMLTASHNPPEYNGMKFVLRNVEAISYEGGLNEIKKLSLSGGRLETPVKKDGVESRNYKDDYINFLLKYATPALRSPQKPLSLVLDAGNGSTGIFLPKLLGDLKIKYTPLFFELDGHFPGRGPNPFLPESQKPAQELVKKEGADFGVLFDGDGDRMFVIDEKGEMVRGDLITALLADEIVKPGETALYEIRSSKIVPLTIEKKGGKAEKVRAGHSYIKEAMREKNAVFAGEMSGHYFYRGFYYSDSAFLTLVYLLNIAASRKEPFSEIIKPYQKFFHSGELNFKVENRETVIQKFKEKYKDGKQSFIDGLTVEYDNWWFNIRPSNTEPLVRLVIEADAEAILEEKKEELTRLLSNS